MTRSLSADDTAYPDVLRQRERPPRIFVRGELPSLPGVAVVGARAASEEASTFARELCRDLIVSGFSVWSGGAVGIDRAAHEGALEAGGPTVVVSPSGFDEPYPEGHADLFERVVEAGGAFVSRVPDEAPVNRGSFAARNELLAAFTRATVVVEAGFDSGARNTAKHARRFGRMLLVVPHAPWDPRGAGCALELVRGARAVASTADVLEALGVAPLATDQATSLTLPLARARAGAPGPRARPPAEPLSPDESTVLAALENKPIHIDGVCDRTGLAAMRVAAALLTLTIKTVVVEGPAGSYRRASSSPDHDGGFAREARSRPETPG